MKLHEEMQASRLCYWNWYIHKFDSQLGPTKDWIALAQTGEI